MNECCRYSWLSCRLAGKRIRVTPEEKIAIYRSLEVPDICPITQLKLVYSNNGRRLHADGASLDRIVQGAIGGEYVAGNIQVISSIANSIKSSLLFADYDDMVKYIRDILRPKSIYGYKLRELGL